MLVNRIVRSLQHCKVLSFYRGTRNFSETNRNENRFQPAKFAEIRRNLDPISTRGSDYMNLQDKKSLDTLSEEDLRQFGVSEDIKSDIKRSLNVKEGEEVFFIKEGKGKIFHKEYSMSDESHLQTKQTVFYNPVQTFNRDLSVVVLETYAEILREQNKEKFKGVRILDALAATGLRTIRFMKEVGPSLISQIDACDLDKSATDLMHSNFELNGLGDSKIRVRNQDANVLMFNAPGYYHVIDLDPYGSALPFLDNAMHAIRDGGLLAATFTDMRVLAGPDYSKCFYYYGTSRAPVAAFQENALRILLSNLNTAANKYKKYIVPVLSIQSDFYARLFVTVHSGPEYLHTMLKTANVYTCTECHNYQVHKLGTVLRDKIYAAPATINTGKCDQCNSPLTLNGPLWADPLNDSIFVKKMLEKMDHPSFNKQLDSYKKIYGILHSILNERETSNYPLAVNVDLISKFLNTKIPGQKTIYGAAKQHNFSVAPSYIYKGLYKTNAPLRFFYDLFRQIRKENTAEEEFLQKNIEPNSPAHFCLSQPQKYEFDLKNLKDYTPNKVPTFFPNPQKNWGPMKKALPKTAENMKKEK